MNLVKICLIGIFLLFMAVSFGQPSKSMFQSDTNKVFNKIEKFSNQRKVTRLLYPLFFKPVGTVLLKSGNNEGEQENNESLEQFEGRIIRSVNVISLDPFGFRLNDSLTRSLSIPERIGNELHVKSLPITIRNLILFRRYDRFDSLLIAESQRLIRNQRYVREVSFLYFPVGLDSVDITIKEQDVWSLAPDGSISDTHMDITLKQQNFAGTGHQMTTSFDRSFSVNKNAYRFGYDIPNINNTFISASLNYASDFNAGYRKTLNIERNFISPFARWAGGLLLSQNLSKDSIVIPQMPPIWQKYRYTTYDAWLGTSWQVFKGRSEAERVTNMIIASRWMNVKYYEKPVESYDTLNRYADESIFLASIGINSRKYVQDRYLFKYNVTEDIPIGRSYNLLLGYRTRAGGRSLYSGIKLATGDYYRLGYFGLNLEYGSFIDHHKLYEGVVAGKLTCFSNLFIIGSWKIRQFFKTEATFGINRYGYEFLPFGQDMGKGEFETALEHSSRKIVISFQTQSYAPWNLAGFRLGPYMNYTLGILGNDESGFSTGKIYSRLGIGLIIRNDYLSMNFFEISVSYYPFVPGLGHNIFLPNAMNNRDFTLQDFDTAKPAEIQFR